MLFIIASSWVYNLLTTLVTSACWCYSDYETDIIFCRTKTSCVSYLDNDDSCILLISVDPPSVISCIHVDLSCGTRGLSWWWLVVFLLVIFSTAEVGWASMTVWARITSRLQCRLNCCPMLSSFAADVTWLNIFCFRINSKIKLSSHVCISDN